MSGTRPARPDRRNVGRAGLSARVAGAHLAIVGTHAPDAGARLVPRVRPSGRLAVAVEPQIVRRADRVNDAGCDTLGPPLFRPAGGEPAVVAKSLKQTHRGRRGERRGFRISFQYLCGLCGYVMGAQSRMMTPPSTWTHWPVTLRASSEARNAAILPMSSGV